MRVRAARAPAEPAVCYREGWDWRWWTWARLAAAISGGDPPKVEPGSPGAGAGAWVAPEVTALIALVTADEGSADRSGAAGAAWDPVSAGLPPPPEPTRWRRWLGVPPRDVVVEAAPGATPARLAWLRWALGNGAAVVLAPTPAAWLDVVSFARPTVLWGDRVEAAALLEHLDGRRRAADRLRAFGWVEEVQVPGDVTLAFRRLGVALVAAAGGGSPVAASDG